VQRSDPGTSRGRNVQLTIPGDSMTPPVPDADEKPSRDTDVEQTPHPRGAEAQFVPGGGKVPCEKSQA